MRFEDQDRNQLLATAYQIQTDAQLLSSRIAVVNEIATAINNSLSLDEILQVVANDARWLLNFEHCSVYIRKIGEPWGLVTLFGPALDTTISLDDNDPIQCALRTGQRQLIHTDGLNSNAAGAGMPDKGILAPYSSLMIIPLQSEGGVIGTLNFATTTPDTYNADD
ncbi:MAG: GAF domain-containing protein, partial [Burkholderiales bacterium]|nr:GAF domain-containing protein [Anaerolineae bacterium]